MDISQILWLALLVPVSFIQNMMFTMVSRSRNSADPSYHRWCAWGSNSVWFICQVIILKSLWAGIMGGQWWYIGLAGIVYMVSTAEGSVAMMKHMLKREKGARRVGASLGTAQKPIEVPPVPETLAALCDIYQFERRLSLVEEAILAMGKVVAPGPPKIMGIGTFAPGGVVHIINEEEDEQYE